jgi:CHAT domain-containing protein
MRPQRIGLIALLTVLATLTTNNFQFIKTPKLQVHNQLVLAQIPTAQKAEADRLIEQGREQFESKQFEAAFNSFQQALVIYQQIQDREGKTKAIVYSASAYYYFLKTEADDLLARGIKEFKSNQFETALDLFQQALSIYQKIKEPQGEWRVLNNLGNTYDELGDYQQGIKYFQQGLASTREHKDFPGEVVLLYSLATTYYNHRDYNLALDYFQECLKLSRTINDYENEALALEGLLGIYDNQTNYANVMDYAQQLLALSQKVKNPKIEGKALLYFGKLYDSMRNYAEAIKYYQSYLTLSRALKDSLGERNALAYLADAFSSVGDYAQAREYNLEILAFSKKTQDSLAETVAMGNLGATSFSLGNYTEAMDYYEQYLRLAQRRNYRQQEAEALATLAVTNIVLDNRPKAVQYAQQSWEIVQKIQEVDEKLDVLNHLGIIYLGLADYPKAIESWQQCLTLLRELKNHNYRNEGVILSNLGNALFLDGKLLEAEQALNSAAKIWESVRTGVGSDDSNKVSIFQEQFRTYKVLQQVLIAQNRFDEALEISEQGRARAFVELLARKLSSSSTEKLAIATPKIFLIKDIAKKQNSTFVQYSIIDNGLEGFKFLSNPPAPELALFIWVIKPTGEVVFRKVDLQHQLKNTSLEALVYTSRDSIGVRGLSIIGVRPRPGMQESQAAKQSAQLQQLYQLLIEPIADLLPTDPNAHIVFIPQEFLFLVPFGALQDKEGKYLIEKHTILTAPSIQVLELTHQQRQRLGSQSLAPLQGNDALVVGNPTMPSVQPAPDRPPQPLPSLPGAETEANAIAPLLNTKPLIGNKATKSVVEQLMSKARIIHLATHGLLDDVRGLGSAIALAPDSSYKEEIGKVNGLLTAEEILDLKLNAELVVLSACNTGRGKITGDGVIGLSRSLISAGVPSVLVSLWSVPDAPTAQLMTEFYRNLQKNPDKAQALRQAMLTIMKQHPNPKDWAAFTLIGESH